MSNLYKFAIQGSRLNFSEAQKLHQKLSSESGDEILSAAITLPSLISPMVAQNFLAAEFQGDYKKNAEITPSFAIRVECIARSL